jgi:hypothetical protein
MARSNLHSWRPFITAVSSLGIVSAIAGCGRDSIDVVPVTGRVLVDGEPLQAKSGNVAFVPDKAKGNTSTIEPIGYLDEEGNYTLYYAQGKKGAPPGWYRIQVAAALQHEEHPNSMSKRLGGGPRPPLPLFNSKFTHYTTSPLEVEVVRDPAPGAYDLNLTK